MSAESEEQHESVQVPLIRNAYAQALLNTLEAQNVSSLGIAQRAGLPLLEDAPSALIPKRPLFRFMDLISSPELPLFGFETGVRMASSGHTRTVIEQASVGATAPLVGLRRTIELFKMEANEMPIGLAEGSASWWLWEVGPEQSKSDPRPSHVQLELLTAGVMLTAIRYYLGRRWQTPVMELRAHHVAPALRAQLPLTNFNTGKACLALKIPAMDLLRYHHARPSAGQSTLPHRPIPVDLVEGLKVSLIAYLNDTLRQSVNINLAAEIARTSTRTLQRALHQRGLTFRELYREALFESACHHLAEPAMPIAEIALFLGYSDPSHFTRAFKQASGVTPVAYRSSLTGSA